MNIGMVKLTDRMWVNPAHVMLVVAAADGLGSVVSLVDGLNLAAPDPPHVVASRLAAGAPPLPAPTPPPMTRLRLVPGSGRDE